ncbi:DUF3999 domain-containing protein [Luteimonas sp. RIT-PG2_3]
MKRWWWLCLLVLPGGAAADVLSDYATRWPLTLATDDAGAYRVEVSTELYRATQSPALRDLDVINADGQTVPATVFAAAQPETGTASYRELRWFPLPVDARQAVDDIALEVRRNADGSVVRIETRGAGASTVAGAANARAWLIDASAVRERIVALELEWRSDASFDHRYRVEASDDLRSWQVVQSHVQLVELRNGGAKLEQRRIPLDGQGRYLRLSPVAASSGESLPLTRIHAVIAPRLKPVAWQWQALQGQAVKEANATAHLYRLDGRFPVEQVDLLLDGNDAAEWILYSRDADDASWQRRAGPWMAFQVGQGADGNRSPSQMLGHVVRDRQWKLVSRSASAASPQLRLGYRNESLVFLAQGPGPYAVVAGSVRTTRAQAPLPELIAAMRRQRGDAWQPGTATIGASQALAGAAALTAAPTPRDWKAWLLWGVLIVGAAVVAGFAMSLLRQRSPGASDAD